MKKAILFVAFVVACGGSEQPAADTSAMAAAPAGLAVADLIGTWNGTSWFEGTDSLAGNWTAINADGVNGKIVFEGQPDTVTYTITVDADSLVTTSVAYNAATLPGKPRVTFRGVGRMAGGKLAGTTALLLASKPDSVVGRVRWEATKSP